MDPSDIPKEDVTGLSLEDLQKKYCQLENAT